LTNPADEFNERTIAEFRANHGRVGGGFAGAPLLLLHTVGAIPVIALTRGDAPAPGAGK
jgi:hypothetical protein